MHKGMTFTRFCAEQEALAGGNGDLTALLDAVNAACRRLSDLVRRGEIAGVLGTAGQENVQGEEQKKLDIIANDIFIESTEWTGQLAALASEEMDNHYPISGQFKRGNFLMTFDPLDGSSNIDVNGATGTIFSITRFDGEGTPGDDDFLQSGRQQVCAGYCLYSSASMMVITLGNGVAGFTLDNSIGDFVLTHPEMNVPAATNEFAINAAYSEHWQAPVKQYINECVQGADGVRGKAFNMRWAGSMVGDVHRILCRGGVFLYPLDERMIAKGAAGKLRLLYEANPMGMLMEQAGGLAHTGVQAILDIQPDGLHQRVPVIMGSSEEVKRLLEYHQSQT
ncbi:MAG: class 1 fructose-bisphosphatase [Granulosicoccaceae bacterium]